LKKRKRYRGKWTESCLSAVVISKLLGCSLLKTKRLLYELSDKLGTLDEDMIGMLIQEVRNQNDLRMVNKVVYKRGKKEK